MRCLITPQQTIKILQTLPINRLIDYSCLCHKFVPTPAIILDQHFSLRTLPRIDWWVSACRHNYRIIMKFTVKPDKRIIIMS